MIANTYFMPSYYPLEYKHSMKGVGITRGTQECSHIHITYCTHNMPFISYHLQANGPSTICRMPTKHENLAHIYAML
jgi:hypothetical protein